MFFVCLYFYAFELHNPMALMAFCCNQMVHLHVDMLTLLSQHLIDAIGSVLPLTVVPNNPKDSLEKLGQLLPRWQ